MNEQKRTGNLSPQTKRAQGGVGAPHLQKGGPDGDIRGPRGDGGTVDRRYGEGGARTDPSQGDEREGTASTSRGGGTGEANR